MSGREPVEATISGFKVISEPLPFKIGQRHLPDVGELVALLFDDVAPLFASGKIKLDKLSIKDPSTLLAITPYLLPLLGKVSRHFGDGKLEYLAPKLLSSTFVIMSDMKGEPQKKELANEADRNYVFDERPDLFLPVLVFAGSVTYLRFFPDLGQLAAKIRGGASS